MQNKLLTVHIRKNLKMQRQLEIIQQLKKLLLQEQLELKNPRTMGVSTGPEMTARNRNNIWTSSQKSIVIEPAQPISQSLFFTKKCHKIIQNLAFQYINLFLNYILISKKIIQNLTFQCINFFLIYILISKVRFICKELYKIQYLYFFSPKLNLL